METDDAAQIKSVVFRNPAPGSSEAMIKHKDDG